MSGRATSLQEEPGRCFGSVDSMTVAPRRRLLTALLAGAALSTVFAPSAFAGTAWTWRAAGTLGATPACSKVAVIASHHVCGYRVSNAPRLSGTVTGVVRVKNTSAKVTCYGVSLSTSYMAGLQSFCVKPDSFGQYRTSGPARHYEGTMLSFFVTSGSKTSPIQAIGDRYASPFTITFSEPLA